MTAKHQTRTKAGKALLSLAVLGLLAVALQSLAFSDASYVAKSSNSGSIFTAGSLSHTNSMAGGVVLSATGLRPGGPSSNGTLTITGGGTLTGTYTLSRVKVTDTPGPLATTGAPGLSTALTLTVDDVTSGTVNRYTGTVAGFTSCTLGAIGTGAKTFHFTLTYPAASSDPELQGASMQALLQFTGVTP